ncbi:MAG: ribonuclease J, partial [Lactobacillus sp.]|nr:ribonuclease J [Lactobacillus sp.]
VNHLINKLMEGGANVVHGRINNVHTSGHGGQEELKMMVRLTKPKYMIPVHGEYRMQVIHTELAQAAGVPAENTFVLENGEVVCFGPEGSRIAGHIPAGDVYVDTSGTADVGNVVVHDRQVLSEDGLVVVVATVDYKHKRVLAGPDVLSRGFVYMRESTELINQAQKHIYHVLKSEMDKMEHPKDSVIRNAIIANLSDFLYSKTKRRPMILPMLVEKK